MEFHALNNSSEKCSFLTFSYISPSSAQPLSSSACSVPFFLSCQPPCMAYSSLLHSLTVTILIIIHISRPGGKEGDVFSVENAQQIWWFTYFSSLHLVSFSEPRMRQHLQMQIRLLMIYILTWPVALTPPPSSNFTDPHAWKNQMRSH